MAGPLISMPAAVSQMFDIRYGEDGKVQGMELRPDWASFFSSLQQMSSAVSQNGSTTARPTSAMTGRFEGMPFFDRTLGYPVFLKYASSNVWVNGSGTVV